MIFRETVADIQHLAFVTSAATHYAAALTKIIQCLKEIPDFRFFFS